MAGISSRATLKQGFTKPAHHIVAILALGLIAYSNSFLVSMQADEKYYLIDNPSVRSSSDLEEVLRTEPEIYKSMVQRYVVYLSFIANYRLHGTSVQGYHVVNLAIHLVNGVLVYFLVLSTFQTPFLRRSLYADHASYAAFCVALLFISHPLHTEAVTYIMQRIASLVSLCYLLSLVLYVQWRLASVPAEVHEGESASGRLPGARTRTYAWYLGALAAAMVAMKSKENAFTLPFAVLLYELYFFSGRIKPRLAAVIPFILIGMIVPLTTLWIMQKTGLHLGAMSLPESDISRYDFFVTQFRVVVTYLRMLVLPIGQNFIHDFPVSHSLREPAVLAAAFVLAGLAGSALYLYVRSQRGDPLLRVTSFGIVWFFLTLSMEASVIPLPRIMFEYRVYLPSVGFLMAIVAAMFMLGRQRVAASRIVAAAVIVSLVLAAATFRRNSIWSDNVKLYEDAVRKSPQQPLAHASLGHAYAAAQRLDDAAREYLVALRQCPQYTEVWYNLALTYGQQGKIDTSMKIYSEILKSDPESVMRFYNPVLMDARERKTLSEYFRSGKRSLEAARRLYEHGNFSARLGNTHQAMQQFLMALMLQPEHRDAHYQLGNLYVQEGRYDDARAEYLTVVRLDPGHVESRINLSGIYVMTGRYLEAREHLLAVLERDPYSEDAKYNLQIVENLIRQAGKKQQP